MHARPPHVPPHAAVPPAVAAILRGWGDAEPLRAWRLSATGFSGAPVWLVECTRPAGRWVLKPFSATASESHVAFVHGLARHLRDEGVDVVPEVRVTSAGGTTVLDADGRRWELCRFMPGVAVPEPSAAQSAAAATALARLHIAAARLPGHPPATAVPRALVRRIEQAATMRDDPWETRRAGLPRCREAGSAADVVDAIVARFDAAIATFAAMDGPAFVERSSRLAARPGRVQAVLRDIWCEHVLFEPSAATRVTGIVDLHAAGIDTPATDLARLLGSWDRPVSGPCHGLLDRWPEARAAYEAVRPLDEAERRLVGFLHGTGVVFALDNWFRWTLEERRTFADPRRVIDRIGRLAELLPDAMIMASDGWGNVD